ALAPRTQHAPRFQRIDRFDSTPPETLFDTPPLYLLTHGPLGSRQSQPSENEHERLDFRILDAGGPWPGQRRVLARRPGEIDQAPDRTGQREPAASPRPRHSVRAG